MGLASSRPLSTQLRSPTPDGPGLSPDPVVRYLASHFALRPVDATFVGVHDHDARLPDWSPQGVERLRGTRATWRDSLGAAGTALTTSHLRNREWPRIDAALIDSYLEIQDRELDTGHFISGNPSLVVGEIAFGIVSLVTRAFAPAQQRAEDLAGRLRAVEEFVAGVLATWRAARPRLPARWTERALRECAATQRLVQDGLALWIAATGLEAPLATSVHRAAASALRGLAAFADALRAQTSDAPIRGAGPDLLALLVKRGHWCGDSLDDLRERARADLEEASATLRTMAGTEGVEAALARLLARRPSGNEYYTAFGQVWNACREVALAHDLVAWPATPVRYVPIPPWTASAAGSLYYLYYRSPAPFEPATTHDYVVPPIEDLAGPALEAHLRAWNHSAIKLNHVVHHGALGHHVQNAHAALAPSRVGQIAATDCASRIAMFQGGTMAEGWACYATDLMDEVGFLTPDERIAEQQSRVRMAARAVVDIELHSGRRGYEDAVGLYTHQVGMSPEAAQNEVTKNSMFPATALMYWLGTSAIHALRAELSRRDGPRFSLRRFHDTLLSFGSIPVPLIAELMRHDGNSATS